MSQSLAQPEPVQDTVTRVLRVFTLVAQTAVALWMMLSGGVQPTGSALIEYGAFGAKITLPLTLSAVITPYSKDFRLIMRDAMHEIRLRMDALFRSAGTKVPIETGLLRESFHVEMTPDGQSIVLSWTPSYAAYLWEAGLSGQVTRGGKAHSVSPEGRVPGTLKYWGDWAAAEALPIITSSIAHAFESHGATVEVT